MYVLGPPNFTGLRCEQGRFIVKKRQVPILFLEVDVCSSNPCKSNGRCLSTNSSYRCECYDGYMGENCDGNKNIFSISSLLINTDTYPEQRPAGQSRAISRHPAL